MCVPLAIEVYGAKGMEAHHSSAGYKVINQTSSTQVRGGFQSACKHSISKSQAFVLYRSALVCCEVFFWSLIKLLINVY